MSRAEKLMASWMLLLVALVAPAVSAQVPASVTYQGVLLNGQDLVEDGAYDLRFGLFRDATGGAPVATLELAEIPVVRGAFNAEVGPLFVDVDGSLFLEVAVRAATDPDYDVLPRVQVSSVPFARRSAYAEFAGGVEWANVINAPVPLQGEMGPIGPVGPQGPLGPVGPQGISVMGSDEAPGNNCAEGGIRLESGSGVQYVCNGISVFGNVEPPGAACPAGGVRLYSASGDVVVCHGAPGAQGVAGPQGPQGIQGPQGPAGATGAVGPQGPPGPVGPQGQLGPQGPIGDTGPAGPQGPQGVAGATGATGATGSAGPQGPVGPVGPQGPAGPAGGGLMLFDGFNTPLGKATSVGDRGVSVITSTGHLVFVEWTGIIPTAQVYYSDLACTTNPHLNAGWSNPDPLYGKTVVRLATGGQLMVPSDVAPNGVSYARAMQGVAIDNPTCMPYPPDEYWGWPLRMVSPGEVGLPFTIQPPLRLE